MGDISSDHCSRDKGQLEAPGMELSSTLSRMPLPQADFHLCPYAAISHTEYEQRPVNSVGPSSEWPN